ncbi:MAG: hypothetical protein WBB36_18690 [Chitinophagales bacterium]
MKKILWRLTAVITLSVTFSFEINAQPLLDNTFSTPGTRSQD